MVRIMPVKHSQAVSKAPIKAQDPKFIRSDKFLATYSNNAQMKISNWDCAITFGEVIGESDGAPLVEQRVTITMSPQHLKAFTSVLQGQVKQYEDLFGEIRWQPKEAADKNAPI